MIFRPGLPAAGASLCSLLLSLFAAPSASAQDDASGAEPDAEAEDSNAPAPAAEPEPAAVSAADAITTATGWILGLQRLPASAFPEPQPRGIAGGSLRMNMHGLQWPYLPGGPGSALIGFSGQVWVDTSYRKVDSGVPDTDPSVREWRQQSRFVLRSTPTYNAGGDWFVQGQGEFVLTGAAPASTQDFLVADDLYVRVGRWNRFDLTAGRFQGWEIYHLGMGLDLNTVERDGARTDGTQPVDLYGVTYYWDRPNGPGRLAVHYYATDYLRFELMGQVGATALNALGVRPVAILDWGVVKLKIGAEYGKDTPRQQTADRKDKVQRSGVGGTLQTVLQPWFEAGLAAAYGSIDSYNAQGVLDAGRSSSTYSYGGFANVRVVDSFLLGAGLDLTHENNLKIDATGRLHDIRTHLQAFGAAQYALWDSFYIKAVVAYANAHFNPESDPPPVSEFRNEALSGRLRLQYLF